MHKGRKKKFDDRYKRMTTYIEVDLYNEIQYMRENEKIKNITKFFNLAIKNYLETIERK